MSTLDTFDMAQLSITLTVAHIILCVILSYLALLHMIPQIYLKIVLLTT